MADENKYLDKNGLGQVWSKIRTITDEIEEVTAAGLNELNSKKIAVSDISTDISADKTSNTKVASAKAVYDMIGNVEEALANLIGN